MRIGLWYDDRLIFRASDFVFYSKVVVDGFLCDSHHCQSTFVGKSESYNELFRDSPATQFCREFTCKNAAELKFVTDEHLEDNSEDEVNACPEFGKTFFWEASQKSLAAAVWTRLTVAEATERGIVDSYKFGPRLDETGARLTYKQTRDEFMAYIDQLR